MTHQPCTKPVWLDRRKTGADLLPNRILRQALREVHRLETASFGKEVEACFRSKKIYVGTGPDTRCLGELLYTSTWRWKPEARDRFRGTDLDALLAEIQG